MLVGLLGIGALVAFLLSAFLQAFAFGRNKFDILKWGYLCLLIGGIFVVSSWPLGDGCGELPDWQGYVHLTLLFASSLGSGYFCGRRCRRAEVKEG